MFKTIITWAILAAALINGAPTNSDSFDGQLESRDSNPEEGRAISGEGIDARDFPVAGNAIGIRAAGTLTGLANFEKLDTSILPLRQIGKYGGLFWQGIAPVSAGRGNFLVGINAFSPPNVAIYGTLTRLGNSKAFITTQFSGSTTASFSLDSFYFGCLGTIVLPTRCTVALAGYDRANKLLAYQSFIFNPGGFLSLKSEMQFAKLNRNFKGLSSVRLASTYTGLNLLGTTAIDNLNYTITTTS